MTRQALTKRADRVFGEAVRSRGVCELALLLPWVECSGPHECCHIIGRAYRATRWEEGNALCGCAAHHEFGHANPMMWREAMFRLLGEDTYYDLYRRAREDAPEDPREIIDRYTKGGS